MEVGGVGGRWKVCFYGVGEGGVGLGLKVEVVEVVVDYGRISRMGEVGRR